MSHKSNHYMLSYVILHNIGVLLDKEWVSRPSTLHQSLIFYNRTTIIRLGGLPLSKAYTDYSFVWPPPSEKGTLEKLIC